MSAHEAVPFASYQGMPYSTARLSGQTFEDQAAPVLRLVPPQQQSDFDSSTVDGSPTDQGCSCEALLRLRSDDTSEAAQIAFNHSSRGKPRPLPNPVARVEVAETMRWSGLSLARKRSRVASTVQATNQIQRPVKIAVMSFWRNKSAMNMGP